MITLYPGSFTDELENLDAVPNNFMWQNTMKVRVRVGAP